jgi:hypothetical protein
MFRISIAGLTVEIDNKYGYVRALAKDYITEAAPDFAVSCTSAEIELESNGIYSPEYSESIVIYRKIAEVLPRYGAVVFHGAVLASDSRAYAFTARSGVGKTTHIRLWKEAFGDKVSILNGDKPVLRVIDGKIYACGTPYNGKEGYGKQGVKLLSGIAFLERGEENSYSKISASEGLVRFMGQIYMNAENPLAMTRTLRFANKALSEIPLYEFKCNMDISAAEMAKEAFLSNS